MDEIARETGAVIGGKIYTDALSDPDGPAGTYIDMMRHNVREFSKALIGREGRFSFDPASRRPEISAAARFSFSGRGIRQICHLRLSRSTNSLFSALSLARLSVKSALSAK